QLAAEMLATTLGMDLVSGPLHGWDEKRESWRMSGRIVDTRSITQSAIGDRGGAWTTVLAAAVLLSESRANR
ncbi:MAG: pyruvoyl-dependent arginine decarboxylase, partial [Acidobacteria bacterium]